MHAGEVGPDAQPVHAGPVDQVDDVDRPRAQPVHVREAQRALTDRGAVPADLDDAAAVGWIDPGTAAARDRWRAQSVHADTGGAGPVDVYRVSARAAVTLAHLLADRRAGWHDVRIPSRGWWAPCGTETPRALPPGPPWRLLDRDAVPELQRARAELLAVDVVLEADRGDLDDARVAGEPLQRRPEPIDRRGCPACPFVTGCSGNACAADPLSGPGSPAELLRDRIARDLARAITDRADVDLLSGPRTAADTSPEPSTPGKGPRARLADEAPRPEPIPTTVTRARIAADHAAAARAQRPDPFHGVPVVDLLAAEPPAGPPFAAGAFRAPVDVDELAARVLDAGRWHRHTYAARWLTDLPDLRALPVLSSFVDLADGPALPVAPQDVDRCPVRPWAECVPRDVPRAACRTECARLADVLTERARETAQDGPGEPGTPGETPEAPQDDVYELARDAAEAELRAWARATPHLPRVGPFRVIADDRIPPGTFYLLSPLALRLVDLDGEPRTVPEHVRDLYRRALVVGRWPETAGDPASPQVEPGNGAPAGTADAHTVHAPSGPDDTVDLWALQRITAAALADLTAARDRIRTQLAAAAARAAAAPLDVLRPCGEPLPLGALCSAPRCDHCDPPQEAPQDGPNWTACPEHGPQCGGPACCCADLHAPTAQEAPAVPDHTDDPADCPACQNGPQEAPQDGPMHGIRPTLALIDEATPQEAPLPGIPDGWPLPLAQEPDPWTGPATLYVIPPGHRVHWRRGEPYAAPQDEAPPQDDGEPFGPAWRRTTRAAVLAWAVHNPYPGPATEDASEHPQEARRCPARGHVCALTCEDRPDCAEQAHVAIYGTPAPGTGPCPRIGTHGAPCQSCAPSEAHQDVAETVRAQLRRAFLAEYDRQVLGTGPGEPLRGLFADQERPQETADQDEAPQDDHAQPCTVHHAGHCDAPGGCCCGIPPVELQAALRAGRHVHRARDPRKAPQATDHAGHVYRPALDQAPEGWRVWWNGPDAWTAPAGTPDPAPGQSLSGTGWRRVRALPEEMPEEAPQDVDDEAGPPVHGPGCRAAHYPGTACHEPPQEAPPEAVLGVDVAQDSPPVVAHAIRLGSGRLFVAPVGTMPPHEAPEDAAAGTPWRDVGRLVSGGLSFDLPEAGDLDQLHETAHTWGVRNEGVSLSFTFDASGPAWAPLWRVIEAPLARASRARSRAVLRALRRRAAHIRTLTRKA